MNFLRQTKPIRPEKGIDPSQRRPRNTRYLYTLTAFVSIGGFLFGWNQGVLAQIVADERWLDLMDHPGEWSIGLVVSIYNIGCAVGAMTIGIFADNLGRERTISLASAVFIVGALLQAAATTVTQITTGRFVLGLGNGAYAAGVPLYISEISPANLRGRIVGIELMILCFGEMVVFWFAYACFFMESPDWWRLPLAIQIAPALVLAVGCWVWVPPSPRWLVAQERYDCAQEVLSRLHGSDIAEQEIREIRESILVESSADKATWLDMFRGPVLRVTMLGMGIQFFQQISGTNSILYYAPSLFRRGGITDPVIANLATGGVGIVLFVTSWIPIFVFDHLPRKTWLQLGTVGMFGALIGIAALQKHAVDHPDDPGNYAIVAFPYIFYTFFNMSWSSGSWTYAAEIFPISLRAKGNAICTASLWVSNFIVAQVSPPIAAAIGWGMYVMYAIICAIAFVFVRYALVETKGRTLEEMAQLFGIEKETAQQDELDAEHHVLLDSQGVEDEGLDVDADARLLSSDDEDLR